MSEATKQKIDSSSESDTDVVECPKCGHEVHKRGIGSHKDSKKCKVYQDKREIRERELVSINLASNRVEQFLRESEYPVEELACRYNEKPHNYSSSQTVKKDTYTTEEGMEEVRRQVFPNASENGIRAEIEDRLDGTLVCSVDSYAYDEELLFVDVDTDEDVSRRRVTYIRQFNDVAFTTGGNRIGDVYTPKEATSELNINAGEIASRLL